MNNFAVSNLTVGDVFFFKASIWLFQNRGAEQTLLLFYFVFRTKIAGFLIVGGRGRGVLLFTVVSW